jgi:hypothetical protein
VEKERVIDTDGQVLIKFNYEYGKAEYRNNKDQLHRSTGPALIEP